MLTRSRARKWHDPSQKVVSEPPAYSVSCSLSLSSHKAGVFILGLLANEPPCHCLAVVNRMGSVILTERLELRGLHKLGERES